MDGNHKYKVYPLGENALTIDFGNEISPRLNDIVTQLATRIESNPFPGFIECVPAYSSLSIFYDLVQTKKKFRTALTAFEITKSFVEMELYKLERVEAEDPRTIEIPVKFSKRFAPDLDFVADKNNLTPDKVIEIFLSSTYRVFMLGFLPGFPYMGEVDDRIATPRRETPRTRVAKGSVGIAGKQTGIYPLESPGGWQIIGRTSVELFNAQKDEPTLVRAGDMVKFVKE